MENELAIINEDNKLKPIEETVANAEKYLELMNKIRLLAISMITNDDISDQGGKPYIEKSGCDKIMRGFGVSLQSPVYEREHFQDDKGEYYLYTCLLIGSWNNNESSEIGTCSTRDKFFGRIKDTFKPISEVDITNIKKKAYTNAANRVIKKLLALSFTWEELEQISDSRINRNKIKKVEFGSGSRGGNTDSTEVRKKRDECREMLLKLNDGEETSAKSMLIELTTFKGRDGNMVAGKDHMTKLSEKQVTILHSNLKKKIEEFDKAIEEGYGQ